MAKKIIKLTESDIHNIVSETVKRIINEGESEGWVVEPYEAQEAYEMGVEYFGEEELNKQIVQCLSTDELSDDLAYIFRMNDFREWEKRKQNQ